EQGALRRLRSLHQAIVDREEQGETLSRLLPTGLAEKVRLEGGNIGETEELVVTVIMSDVRGYSGIAETTDPSALAQLLNEDLARPGGCLVFSEATREAMSSPPAECEPLGEQAIKGRQAAVKAYRYQVVGSPMASPR